MMTVQVGDLTLRSHVLIVRNASLKSLLEWVMMQGFTEFSVAKDGDVFQLSHPLVIEEREEYKWLYHKMKRLNPDDPKPPKGSGPKGGGGGPTGGSPASGVVGHYEDTIAVAA